MRLATAASYPASARPMKKVVIHSETRLLDDYFQVDEAEFSFERFDGHMSAPVRRLCFERGDSVAAVVFNRDTQRVILIEQLRFPAYKKGPGWLLEVVAGIMTRGETPETALRREVREEIGYEIDQLCHIATFYLSPGGSSERVILFQADVRNAGRVSEGGGVPEEGEDIRLVEVSIEALRDEQVFARIQDAKTLVGIMWLLQHGATNWDVE
ncbi:MAG: NUDIX domain-containing protein [Bdellovibrionaceae bacterium]|nr:NUDIX domain-containing protein [Pseudobdellovibrionaceae bacterium]